MTIPGARCTQAIALALLSALGWLSGCSDNPGGLNGHLPPPPEGLVISDPVLTAGVTARAGAVLARPAGATDGGGTVAYVSLAPGTVLAGSRATVRRVGDVASLTTAVLDGGFDPVPVDARAGDFVDVQVTDANGGTVFQQRVAVLAARAPVVVRTWPPVGKRDTPLNATLVIVFSEPVDGATTTGAAVRLLQGADAVPGRVRFLDPSLDASHVRVEFVPDAALVPHTQYHVVVTRDVRDLSGDPLAAAVTADFTTGESSTGPPASILISTDSVLTLAVGETYQLTAVVRDAVENELTDQPVTWASGDINIAIVSPTGLVTTLADGLAPVTASVGAVTKRVYVAVRPNPAASITITPDPAPVAATDTIVLVATARDAVGRLINVPYPPMEWTSSAPAVATVTVCCGIYNTVAKVTGVKPGTATVTATSGTAHGSAVVTITPARPVASVTIVPDSTTLVVSGFAELFAILRDADNQLVSGRTVTWTVGSTGVATVDTSGLVHGVSLGSTRVVATSEGIVDTAAITVTTISLASVSAGGAPFYRGRSHSCGLTTGGAAYCWGANGFGELGLGALQGPEDCGGNPCATVPAVVAGGLTFTSLSTGVNHSCAVTTGGNAYCWGDPEFGELGNGSNLPTAVPVAVSGGVTFAAVTAGGNHSCGGTTSGAAYCWGQGIGQFGWSDVPVAVSGGLNFTALAAGTGFTCGLTTSGTAYCWGQIYDDGTVWSAAPEAVGGGLTFVSLTSGHRHACGLTAGGTAYCWGSDAQGELGDGTFSNSRVPVPVSGGLTFSSVSAGTEYTCGITPSGAAYCWGWDVNGELGNGSTTGSAVPVAVTGGLTFASVRAGGEHSCGRTTTGATYCWGLNWDGRLGNGSTTTSLVPVKVLGQP